MFRSVLVVVEVGGQCPLEPALPREQVHAVAMSYCVLEQVRAWAAMSHCKAEPVAAVVAL